jgi:hypothetical protein
MPIAKMPGKPRQLMWFFMFDFDEKLGRGLDL